MQILGQRIIAVLRADTTLTTLLGSANNVFARGLNEPGKRPTKYVCVETIFGKDINYADAQDDEIEIEIGVSRSIVNSFSVIMSIIERVNAVLNKKELTLSNSSWKVIHFVYSGSPTGGVSIDTDTNEYFSVLKYDFILCET